MAPSGVGRTRVAYLFDMDVSLEGLICGVKVLEDDTIVEDGLVLVNGG